MGVQARWSALAFIPGTFAGMRSLLRHHLRRRRHIALIAGAGLGWLSEYTAGLLTNAGKKQAAPAPQTESPHHHRGTAMSAPTAQAAAGSFAIKHRIYEPQASRRFRVDDWFRLPAATVEIPRYGTYIRTGRVEAATPLVAPSKTSPSRTMPRVMAGNPTTTQAGVLE